VPTSIFIDIVSGILIIIGIICLLTAFKKDFMPERIRNRKFYIAARSKRIHLVFIGFGLLVVSTALLLFY
jgi:hypothetical protein